jgi:cytochrome b pre-mRNA-processing protein 3
MKGTARVASWLKQLFRSDNEQAALRPLWQRVVELAREPGWYRAGEHGGGIADTVSGRFDAITLVLALVLLRMERDPALIASSARLAELFVSDMEGQLRQSGIGDPTLGKQMGKLMSTLGGRIGALRDGLAAEGEALLTAAVARNVSLIEGADPAHVAAELRVLAGELAALDTAELLAGRIVR